MKQIGIIRPLDQLGRIVLPKELRRAFDINPEDYLEITADYGQIILRKYEPGCTFCGSNEELRQLNGKRVCSKCIEKLLQTAIIKKS